MSAFAITSTIEEQRAIVRCEGELDLETSADADSHLRKVEDAEVSEIVLDLRML
jgi:anti-anti-sigma regulatory factor